MSKHYFPGGNTPAGFFSYFHNIAFRGERTVFLKGASGCGKSTFMRKAAAACEARGFAVEYFHCSNDPESLDGIRVPGAFCIVDATAPHVQDPPLPVARDELFNMAVFIDPLLVEKHREELAELALRKKQSYETAYGYLAAAWALYQNNSRIYDRLFDRAKLNAAILEALSLFDGAKPTGRAGRDRRLFAGALTPDGFVNRLGSLMAQENLHVLRGEPGMGTDILLERIRDAAILRGLDCESLCCPLDPARIEHLLVPDLGLGFFTQSRLWPASFPASAHTTDFAGFLHESLEEYREEIAYNNATFDELAGRAVRTLAAQRAMHDRVEELYIAGMDFDGLNRACDGMIARLMERM